MADLAELAVEERGGTVVARIRGEIDASNRARVGERLLASIPNRAAAVVIDFTDTRYLDSSAIQLLFEIASKVELRRQELRVVAPAGSFVEEVLRAVSLGDTVAVDDDLEKAVSKAVRA
jgi:anti-anti-sigma factor